MSVRLRALREKGQRARGRWPEPPFGEGARRLSENEIFFPRSRKAKIITTGIHLSISRIII